MPPFAVPRYNDFKAEFIDSQGREYALAKDDDDGFLVLSARGSIDQSAYERYARDLDAKTFLSNNATAKEYGQQLFYTRLPTRQDGMSDLKFPRAAENGGQLRLLHLQSTQAFLVTYKAIIPTGRRAKTGYFVSYSFRTVLNR